MPSIYAMSQGKGIKFTEALHRAGFDEALVDTIIERNRLTERMVNWLREELKAPLSLSEVFVSLKDQLDNVRRWNAKRNWGFSNAEIDAIDLKPNGSIGLAVDVIAVYLPDEGEVSGVQRTFNEFWDILQPISRRWDYPMHLRLFDGIEHIPGIRRVTLILSAYKGLSPARVRNEESAHAEVLAAAAHFPMWGQAMAEQISPFVWMPGYQILNDGARGYHNVPLLSWGVYTPDLSLTGLPEYVSGPNYACPVVGK